MASIRQLAGVAANTGAMIEAAFAGVGMRADRGESARVLEARWSLQTAQTMLASAKTSLVDGNRRYAARMLRAAVEHTRNAAHTICLARDGRVLLDQLLAYRGPRSVGSWCDAMGVTSDERDAMAEHMAGDAERGPLSGQARYVAECFGVDLAE